MKFGCVQKGLYVSGAAQAISSDMYPAAIHMHAIKVFSLTHESLEGRSIPDVGYARRIDISISPLQTRSELPSSLSRKFEQLRRNRVHQVRLLTTIDWHKIAYVGQPRKGRLLGCANLTAFESVTMAKKYVACNLHRSDDWLAVFLYRTRTYTTF